MIKLTIILSLTGLALLLQPAARAAEGCVGTRPGLNHITVMSGGQKQSIDLVLPPSFVASKRVPLVIGLHPSGGSGRRDLSARTPGSRGGGGVKLDATAVVLDFFAHH